MVGFNRRQNCTLGEHNEIETSGFCSNLSFVIAQATHCLSSSLWSQLWSSSKWRKQDCTQHMCLWGSKNNKQRPTLNKNPPSKLPGLITFYSQRMFLGGQRTRPWPIRNNWWVSHAWLSPSQHSRQQGQVHSLIVISFTSIFPYSVFLFSPFIFSCFYFELLITSIISFSIFTSQK